MNHFTDSFGVSFIVMAVPAENIQLITKTKVIFEVEFVLRTFDLMGSFMPYKNKEDHKEYRKY